MCLILEMETVGAFYVRKKEKRKITLSGIIIQYDVGLCKRVDASGHKSVSELRVCIKMCLSPSVF